MREKIQIAAVTVAILAVGMALGFWLAHRRPLPHPAWEHPGGPGPGQEEHHEFHPEQVDAFRQRLDALQPQVKDFQDRFAAMEDRYHTAFAAVLTEQQRAMAPHHPPGPIDWTADLTPFGPGSAGPMEGLPGLHPHQGRVSVILLRILMYEPTLKIMTERLQLTPDQVAKIRPLMEARRQELVTLCREHPLPLDQIYFSMRDAGLLHERKEGPPTTAPATPPQPPAAPAPTHP